MAKDTEENAKKRKLYTDADEIGRILALGIVGKYTLSDNEQKLVDAVTSSFNSLGLQTMGQDEEQAEQAWKLYQKIEAARDAQILPVLQERLVEGKRPALKELSEDLRSKDRQRVADAVKVHDVIMYLVNKSNPPPYLSKETAIEPSAAEQSVRLTKSLHWPAFQKAYEPVKRNQMNEVAREDQLDAAGRFNLVKKSLPLLLDQIYLGSIDVSTGKQGTLKRLNDALDILGEAHKRKLGGTKSWVVKVRKAVTTMDELIEQRPVPPKIKWQMKALKSHLEEEERAHGIGK